MQTYYHNKHRLSYPSWFLDLYNLLHCCYISSIDKFIDWYLFYSMKPTIDYQGVVARSANLLEFSELQIFSVQKFNYIYRTYIWKNFKFLPDSFNYSFLIYSTKSRNLHRKLPFPLKILLSSLLIYLPTTMHLVFLGYFWYLAKFGSRF